MNIRKLGNLASAMRTMREKGLVPGSSVAVWQGGEKLYEHFEGMADIASGRPVCPETLFRIYSMTKVIVCTAALRLYERGEFLLADEVGDYLPEFRDPRVFQYDTAGRAGAAVPLKTPLRIMDLFSMSSGVCSRGNGNETCRQVSEKVAAAAEAAGGKHTLQDVMRAVASTPLGFEPGSHFWYGYGHDIVGALLERITGKTLGNVLRDEIFAPLGMENTAFRMPDSVRAARLCSMYRIIDGKFTPEVGMDANYCMDATYEAAGGGLLSTLEDYGRFASAMACGETLLGRRTVDLMRTNRLSGQALADFSVGWKRGYGYGLGVRTMLDPSANGSNGPVGEFGWYGMAGSYVLMDPSNELALVYMQQTLPANEGYVTLRLRNVLYSAL